MRLTELRQNEVATSARALQIRGYKFDWQDVEWLTVVIRGPVAVYLLLRGRWASGSRTCLGFLGQATDARCMAVSRPLFSAFDDRTLTTRTFIIPFYFVLADSWASRNLRFVRRISTDKRACIDWSGHVLGGRLIGNYAHVVRSLL